MNEKPQPSAAPSRAPTKPVAAGAAFILAAVVGVSSFTGQSEGTKYHSYQDGGGVWTIGKGHTGPEVHAGMTATAAQVDAWYRGDMTTHMVAAIKVTPTLTENVNALKAAGDFGFNAGDGWYLKSPMRAHFLNREWVAGCNAFVGYIVLHKAPKPVPGEQCKQNSAGVWYCQAGGLVTRRAGERKICLGLPV